MFRALILIACSLTVASPAAPQNALPVTCADESGPDQKDKKSAGKDKSKKGGDGVQLELAGACATLSGKVLAVHQNQLATSGMSVPTLIGRLDSPSQPRTVNTLTASANLDITRTTAIGDLETSLNFQWLKTSDDEGKFGAFSVQELYGSLAGWTVGYTDSLMNFWSGDFQFTAAAPKRTVGIVSFERDITDDWKLAVAIESGLPSSRQNTEGIRSVDFSSPLLTARWLYEKDDWSFHLSGLVRRAEFSTDSRFPLLSIAATTRTGWAASVGATIPAKLAGEDDEISLQATYASDASPFLGTAVDLSALANVVPTTGPTQGWSAVASFHHVFSDHWEANAFASFLTLTGEVGAARPSLETRRIGLNVYWLPVDSLKFGAEIGVVDTALSANGSLGLFRGNGGKALVGYLSAEWKF